MNEKSETSNTAHKNEIRRVLLVDREKKNAYERRAEKKKATSHLYTLNTHIRIDFLFRNGSHQRKKKGKKSLSCLFVCFFLFEENHTQHIKRQ